MMAARFRSVTWVGVALVPALACYLVTQHVAAERAELAKVERKIGQTRRAIRDLQTELGTRGSMAQIERWNGETFALAAPTAAQFISGDVQLASLNALPSNSHPVIAAAASASARVVAPLPNVQAPAPAAEVHAVTFRAAPTSAPEPVAEIRTVAAKAPRPVEHVAAPVEDSQPMLRQASYTKPAGDRVRAATATVSFLSRGPLDARTLSDIGRIASTERGSRRP